MGLPAGTGVVIKVAFALAIAVLGARQAAADTYTVTTSADSGPGSVRAALTPPCDDRTVRFGVGGEFVSSSSWVVRCKRVFVDGLSAPTPVRIVHRALGATRVFDIFETDGVKIRGLTITAEDVNTVETDHDAVRVWRSRNVVLSRLTLYGEDEAVSIVDSQLVQVSESILRSAADGKCMLIYGPEGDQILVYRNLFDRCTVRTPYVSAGKRVAIVNNVMRGTIGWGVYLFAQNYKLAGEADIVTQVDVEGNLFDPREFWNGGVRVGTDGSPYRPSPGTVSLFMAGNLDAFHRISDVQDGFDGLELLGGKFTRRTKRAWAHGARVVPAAELVGLQAGAP